MAYEKKPNEGSLFKNKDKAEGDTRPHMKGDGIVQFTAGRDIKAGEVVDIPVWLGAYTNTAKTSGERWQKVTFKQKEPRPDAPPAAKPGTDPEFDDDIPF